MTESQRRTRRGLITVVAALAACAGLAPESQAHPLGMYIYRDGDDRLVMIFPWANYWPIKYQIPPFQGQIDGDYPYEEALGDRPASNLFRTHLGAKLEAVIVQMDPGFWVRDPADINIAYHEPGERFVLGVTGTAFLTFPWWHLDSSDPNFIPNQESYSASFYLHDITGIHTDSEVYTFIVYPALGYCQADLTGVAIPGQPGYGVPNQILNNDDFFYFLQQFAAGNAFVADFTTTALPGSPGYGIPDGIVNNDDFFYYISLFSLGC